jgi:hypothetical protein
LIFLTQHPEGLWHMAEAVSLAHEDWRAFCSLGLRDAPEQLVLEGITDPPQQQPEDWITLVASNVEHLLKDGRPFKIIDKMLEVYGDTIGLARSKHVRAAIKRLHEAGVTPTDGKGRVDQMVVHPREGSVDPGARTAQRPA